MSVFTSKYCLRNCLFADIESRLGDTVRGKKRVRQAERVTDIYTLLCVKQVASGRLLYGPGAQLGAL